MRHMDHPPPWSGPYLGYEIQWLRSPPKREELASVQLCDHATSCLQIVALEIQALHMTQANESCTLVWFSIKWKKAWAI
jgi:hypothetical protein